MKCEAKPRLPTSEIVGNALGWAAPVAAAAGLAGLTGYVLMLAIAANRPPSRACEPGLEPTWDGRCYTPAAMQAAIEEDKAHVEALSQQR